MRKISTISVAVLLLAGCGAQTLAPPDYDPPRNHSGKDAFVEALRVDGYENVVEGDPPSTIGPMTSAQHRAYNDRVMTRRHTQTALQGLRKFEIGACEWAASKASDVPRWSRQRITEAPKAVYNCTYKVFYQLSPPIGEKFETEGAGAFFKSKDKFVYMGKIPNPYR